MNTSLDMAFEVTNDLHQMKSLLDRSHGRMN